MGWDNAGYGAGGGLIGALLGAIGSWLGFDKRINRVEGEIEKLLPRTEHEAHKQACDKVIQTINATLLSINEKQDEMLEKLGELKGKVH